MTGFKAGTKQPTPFRCSKAGQLPKGKRHRIVRTGRKRPFDRKSEGDEIDKTSREYVCSCGHTGWSAHKDLKQYAVAILSRTANKRVVLTHDEEDEGE